MGGYYSRLSAMALGTLLLLMMSTSSADSRTNEKSGFFYSDYLSQGGVSSPSLNGDAFVISPTDNMELTTHRLNESHNRTLSSAHNDFNSTPLQRWFSDNIVAGDSSAQFTSSGHNWSSNSNTNWLNFAASEVGRKLQHTASNSFGFLRRAQIDVWLPLGNRPASTGISFVGAFSDSQRHLLGWELRGYGGERAFGGLKTSPKGHKGGSFGLLYRHVSSGSGPFGFGRYGEGLLGLNTFADYENRYGEDFIRWSGGVEVRTSWIDFYGNIYRAVTSPRLGERIEGATADDYQQEMVFTSDGFDTRVNLHAPNHQWLAVVGEYYRWDDEQGEGGESGWRAGLRVEPFVVPVVVEVLHEDGNAGRDWGGRVAFNMDFGKSKAAPESRESFTANSYLYETVNREYSQRIYDVTVTMSP